MKKTMVMGIGYYRREDWPRLLETAVDSHILERTYDEWLDVLDSAVEKIRAQGIEPKLVDVDIDELLAFCKRRGVDNDARARALFISEVRRQKGRKNK